MNKNSSNYSSKIIEIIIVKSICLIVLLLTAFFSQSIAQPDSIEKQIDSEVWMPFIFFYNAKNNDGMKSLHSPQFTRVIIDDNKVQNYAEYFTPVSDSVKAKWALWKSDFEIRFTKRITSGDRAFETGYYKTTSLNSSTREKRTSFGKFYVVLVKENNEWKILLDADTKEGADEKQFLNATPLMY